MQLSPLSLSLSVSVSMSYLSDEGRDRKKEIKNNSNGRKERKHVKYVPVKQENSSLQDADELFKWASENKSGIIRY